MNISTWAIVVATALGPVMAVIITLSYTYWRETYHEKYSRRLNLFRILMSTRQAGVSRDHVNALNLIEVDFYGCKKVEDEWKNYKNHLNDNRVPEDGQWINRRDKLLSKLLFEMALILKLDIPAIEIFEGGYYPSAWQIHDFLHKNALEYIRELRNGSKHLPVRITEIEQQDKINET